MQRSTCTLQARLQAKFRRMRRRNAASKITHLLRCWSSGKPLVGMIVFLTRVKRIQRFVRWAIRRMAEVRTRVEQEWLRLERCLFAEIAKANTSAPPPITAKIRSPATSQERFRTQPEKAFHRTTSARQSIASAVTKVNDQRRRRVLTEELRRRRSKYLIVYEVWLGDMQLYQRDVRDWRAHCQDCKAKGVKPVMDLPMMPPCPSHLPTEDELLEMIQNLKRRGSKQALSKTRGAAGARSSISVMQTSQHGEFGQDSEGSISLCGEVAGLLAPSASRPVPFASAASHRPVVAKDPWRPLLKDLT